MTDTSAIFSYTSHVRVDDLNYGNHLCHTRYVNFVHNARALFLKKHDLSELNCFNLALLIVELKIKYLSQCFFDDELEVSIYPGETESPKARCELKYIIMNHTSHKIAAKASTQMAFYDMTKKQVTKIPEKFIELISA